MFTCAEFQIIGHVGQVREVGTSLKISVAAKQKWNDKSTGEVKEKTRWNTVTVFESSPAYQWLKDNVNTGDLVRATGTIEDSSYDKGGEKIYTVLLKADRISVIPKSQD